MKIIRKYDELDKILEQEKNSGNSIGLVLTMGNIHKGHLSLVNKAHSDNEFIVVTIFVNPTQFNDNLDYKKYPKTIDSDIEKLESSKCNLLYIPDLIDIYPNGLIKEKIVIKYRDILCDKFRPGHFDGVTTVVDTFFRLIKPDNSYFGEKDYQQLKFVTELVKINNYKINIISCPSIRDEIGMSFSSRNSNFTANQYIVFKRLSEKIYKFVNLYKNKKTKIDLASLSKELLAIKITKIDYLEVRNEKDLEISKNYKDARLFIGLYIDQIRIIDNFKLN